MSAPSDHAPPAPQAPPASDEPAPLAALSGRPVAPPAWAEALYAQAPDARFIDTPAGPTELLVWPAADRPGGQAAAPGVLLVHGNGAHAGWWRVIAPLLAREGRNVAALSLAGMGRSAWRDTYAMADFEAQCLSAVAAAGLAGPDGKALIVGHSFGGSVALSSVVAHPGRWSGLVLLDSPIQPPGLVWTGPPLRTAPNRIYPDLAAALARFRLAPPQPCDTLWALDRIARESLAETEAGWTWRFDPFMWSRLTMPDLSALARRLRTPAAVVRGALSDLMGEPVWSHMRAVLPAGTAFATIPEGRHHVLLDQPLATAAALDAALACIEALRGPAAGG